jgi:hypothetical protein
MAQGKQTIIASEYLRAVFVSFMQGRQFNAPKNTGQTAFQKER